ncbi:MAG TPA: RNA 2',3'-cyclic phosphodiesterase [Candidatus Binataceae bacterium]|nr:RNA 2',3'-cyclic phosphodiesterase [Candidatus Binataceae bacterium]
MPDSEKRVRAFIAVRVSDEIEASLDALIARVRAERDGVAWVRPSNLHLTLKFLGAAVDPAKISQLIGLLHSLAESIAPFEIRVGGIGAFPNFSRPYVIWAGLESEPLVALAAQVDEVAAECGFEREGRRFSPHLTLGRVRNPRLTRDLREQLRAVREREFGVSGVQSMTLYRSELAPGGSIYTALATFPFAAAHLKE